ncbi:MAG: hypothetical protein ABIZ95_03920 [Pyrinomonadaceae bacterium]
MRSQPVVPLVTGRELRARTFALITFVIAVSILAIGCGKRRPPLPPVENVPGRTEELTGVQQANQITLSFPTPRRNAPDGSVQSIRRIDVYRLAESPNAPLPLTEEDFANRSTLIGSVTYDAILKANERIIYVDKLELAGQPSRLRYAIRFVNASGQRAAFSNFFLIEPSSQVANPPQLLDVKTGEKAVQLMWQAPTGNIDGSTPANLLGYNIYRTSAKAPAKVETVRLNASPVQGSNYSDATFKFGEKYDYSVRPVSLGSGGNPVEGLDSNQISVTATDVFPPTQPGTPSVAPGPGRLAVFFPSNPETDIAGYFVYRSADPDLAKDKWLKLNSEVLTRTTYQDSSVETGQKYYYYVVAVDQAGNSSIPSDVSSETVP